MSYLPFKLLLIQKIKWNKPLSMYKAILKGNSNSLIKIPNSRAPNMNIPSVKISPIIPNITRTMSPNILHQINFIQVVY